MDGWIFVACLNTPDEITIHTITGASGILFKKNIFLNYFMRNSLIEEEPFWLHYLPFHWNIKISSELRWMKHMQCIIVTQPDMNDALSEAAASPGHVFDF